MTLGLAVPFTDPAALLAWARRADAGPFGRIGVPDRIVYDNPEPMVMLAAMAAATERIRVQSEVVLAPLRDPVLLAKQSATLDRLSGGRFSLGLAVGAREDDFLAVGADHASRGRRMDEQLAIMRRVWAGEPVVAGTGPVGPAPSRVGGPELLFGGFAPELAAQSVASMATTAGAIRDVVAAYRDAGAHEVMLSCWSDDLDQIGRLADLLS
ncbi:unnamed protein product [[Actinomadura] parvosata subsp. kistnae]|uniref:Luciferase-like domain-containing protein n=1 Tax=[Actinomadura] parvosata subsp. kistnae TaxID=1909395 RepID=A0A1V0AH97_9ACTN|nr:LLM class flavin-dependent oxidoreductase [Nonomuraea sp. ATCC 55076]AQZ69587.1 hypothetical protein BKM31_56220 [Nonomuraea sp. ATCC 55076]SPL91725.1 unnamed protein product [Actinomadura parvosata subsp. kistnae]